MKNRIKDVLDQRGFIQKKQFTEAIGMPETNVSKFINDSANLATINKSL